jgi:TonB family protein
VEVLRSPAVPLRVLPDPDSVQGRAEASAAAWARGAEQIDWCVDASVALAAGCTSADSGVATMSASERRAIHLTRQRIRAQAILAAAEPGPEHERRERVRRWGIVIGSAMLHAIGFVMFARAVADLEHESRTGKHEHLFDRAVVPIEPVQTEFVPAKTEVQPQETSTPDARPRRTPSRKAKPSEHVHAEPEVAAAGSSEPYELRGFELSSEGELAGGGSGGESFGGAGGSGSGGDEQTQKPAVDKPDVLASPRGGLLQPEYPPELEREGVEGSVLVKVWIDEHGHVIKAEVVESSGQESFDHNALMTAQRQEWTAAVRDGEAVASTRRYRVHFELR